VSICPFADFVSWKKSCIIIMQIRHVEQVCKHVTTHTTFTTCISFESVKSWIETSMFYLSTNTLDGKRSKNWTVMHEGNSRACWNVGDVTKKPLLTGVGPFVSLLVEH